MANLRFKNRPRQLSKMWANTKPPAFGTVVVYLAKVFSFVRERKGWSMALSMKEAMLPPTVPFFLWSRRWLARRWGLWNNRAVVQPVLPMKRLAKWASEPAVKARLCFWAKVFAISLPWRPKHWESRCRRSRPNSFPDYFEIAPQAEKGGRWWPSLLVRGFARSRLLVPGVREWILDVQSQDIAEFGFNLLRDYNKNREDYCLLHIYSLRPSRWYSHGRRWQHI